MRRRDWLVGVAGLCGALMAGVAVPAIASVPDLASPIGEWRTIDDKTNKPRALIEIYERGGLLFGKVTGILDSRYTNARCQDCSGDRQNQPVMGLEIMRDMHADGARWDGGTILNPETGSIYKCRMHLTQGGQTLVVRGFVGVAMVGRTQTWQRMTVG
jgi:uncharacterized protein (DUF2147 family)